MATRDEIITIIANKLYNKHYDALTFNDLKTNVVALNTVKQAKLLDGILTGKDADVGAFLRELMVATAEANAMTEATSLMADDNLTLAELEGIF